MTRARIKRALGPLSVGDPPPQKKRSNTGTYSEGAGTSDVAHDKKCPTTVDLWDSIFARGDGHPVVNTDTATELEVAHALVYGVLLPKDMRLEGKLSSEDIFMRNNAYQMRVNSFPFACFFVSCALLFSF